MAIIDYDVIYLSGSGWGRHYITSNLQQSQVNMLPCRMFKHDKLHELRPNEREIAAIPAKAES